MSIVDSQLMYAFPKDFLWGVSSSAYQLEGAANNDWTVWEKLGRVTPSSSSTGHWEHAQEDIALIKNLNVNAYRLSLEWSRIEPEPGVFDETALDHYEKLLSGLKQHKLHITLTLHHFTHPAWFHRLAPWHTSQSIERYCTFVRTVFSRYAPYVDQWITFNEPTLLWVGGYLDGVIPPGISEPTKALAALRNLLEAHAGAYRIIKTEHAQNCLSRSVGISFYFTQFEPHARWRLQDRRVANQSHQFFNLMLLNALRSGILRIQLPYSTMKWNETLSLPFIQDTIDFVGINYYTRVLTRYSPHQKYNTQFRTNTRNTHHSDVGWEIYPKGLRFVLSELSRYQLPLTLTENGLADATDEHRGAYIFKHLKEISRAIDKGIPVNGYFYHSWCDGTEWLEGNTLCYGLYAVDRHTQTRTLRESGRYFAGIAKTNKMFTHTDI